MLLGTRWSIPVWISDDLSLILRSARMLHCSLADYVDGRDAVGIVLTQRWLVIYVEQSLRVVVALPSLTQTIRSEIVCG